MPSFLGIMSGMSQLFILRSYISAIIVAGVGLYLSIYIACLKI